MAWGMNGARLMVVAAHPDDETLGAASLLAAARARRVVLVTNGVPRNLTFAPAATSLGRHRYEHVRWQELCDALALIGMQSRDIVALGFEDLELVYHLEALTRALAHQIEADRPDWVVSHAYEGGHPDHDAVAFAVRGALARLARKGIPTPCHGEMALYHGAPGTLVTGHFIEDDEVTTVDDAAMLALKRRLLSCYETQRTVLAPFMAEPHERHRPARTHDFSQPPHAGPLWYERLGMPVSSAAFRTQAMRAAAKLDLPR